MATKRSSSGIPLWRKERRTVYLIKGGKLGGWRGYDETEAKRLLEQYGGKLTSKSVTVSTPVR